MSTPTPLPTWAAWVWYFAKAAIALTVTAAGYLVGVLVGDQTLADVTTVQWLGLIVFAGGAFGITAAIGNGPRPERLG